MYKKENWIHKVSVAENFNSQFWKDIVAKSCTTSDLEEELKNDDLGYSEIMQIHRYRLQEILAQIECGQLQEAVIIRHTPLYTENLYIVEAIQEFLSDKIQLDGKLFSQFDEREQRLFRAQSIFLLECK